MQRHGGMRQQAHKHTVGGSDSGVEKTGDIEVSAGEGGEACLA